MGEPAEQVYTPEQVAEHLQVSLKTIMLYLRSGKLKGFKVGRLWRIRERDLEAFMRGPNDRLVEEESPNAQGKQTRRRR